MMSELEVAYWHAINISKQELWIQEPTKVIEALL
jgi:hypothetical protein